MPATQVILHLGIGSFHRAHQAVYLQRLIDAGDVSWTLAGGNTRPDMADTVAALQAQGGAYTLETVTPAGERRYETIRAIKTIVPYAPGLAGLIRIGADPATRIISFTVTEAGYYLDANDKLDFSFADLAGDMARARDGLAGGTTAVTIYAALTAILRKRRRNNAGKVTLLNCDNLRHNGDRFRGGFMQFLEQVGDAGLRNWVVANTSSPNAMVDRITPRPASDLRERVRDATGWDDGAPVMAESYIQWVIEDDFCNGRPAWEKVGVQMVASVAPYEEAKIRILNGSHSCIGWAGTLAGYGFIHEGARDDRIRRFAHEYITADVIPCLRPSPIDLETYRDLVLERFGNAALADTNQRVAMDSFSKLPGFIVPTIRERLARNESIAAIAMLPALFLAFLQRWHRGDLPTPYQDQAMDAAAAHAICAAADPIGAFCHDRVLWGALAGDSRLIDAMRSASEKVAVFVRQSQP
ncbi:MAG: mannitol dehydrogenase family protein [Betaproteobacteria bacterium]|nr:mannitol dehydrogenase family protein [Betaproteobacteria bacterium]